MTRTNGHKGSQHVIWRSRPTHSSNKLYKADSHRRNRSNINSVIKHTDFEEIGDWDYDILPWHSQHNTLKAPITK